MQELTSTNNPLVKKVQSLKLKKKRNEYGLFLIEGYKCVLEALNCGLKIENIFIGENFNKDLPGFSENLIYKVSEPILKKISTTDTPPDIVAMAHQIESSLDDAVSLTQNPLLLVLENIKDPGNLGTIIRTAKASGATGIILTDETVDIYNPKTVRSSAANLWKIPIVCINDKSNIKLILNKYIEFQYIATIVHETNKPEIYYYIDYTKPTVLLFGSEADGLSEKLAEQADKLITIPMQSGIESLNLSVSVGVILYESTRQRRFNNK